MKNLNALHLKLIHWVFIEHSEFLNRNIDIMNMDLEKYASYLCENAQVESSKVQNQLLSGYSKKNLRVEKNFCQILVQGGM